MTSVTTAPGGASSRTSGATRNRLAEGRRPGSDLLAGGLAAAGFCLVAFLASGGVDLSPNTTVQVGLLVLAAATAIALIFLGRRGPAWGGRALLLFVLLAALTYASIAWSVQPANSWLEANRTLSYLAAFAAALMLARLAPERWRSLVGAVAAATTVVCGYALLVKVFPGSLDPNDPFGRLRTPFDYWNAVGLMGALGLAPCLWAGSRREGSAVLRALAVPGLAILISVVVLSYSRGSIVVAVVGLAVWFVLAPLRLRSALILALGLIGGAVVAAWGSATRGISADGVDLATRTSAGHTFGIVVAVVLCLSFAAGIGAVRLLDRVTLPARAHRNVATALLVLVALIPVAGVGAVAASNRGLTGEISHVWNGLTNPNGIVTGGNQSRLVDLSNSRPHYWSQAITLGKHHLLAGVGALGFATAQPSASGPVWNAQHAHAVHAHGYLAETFADFGLIGLVVSLGLLVAWCLATARTLEFAWPRRHAADHEPTVVRDVDDPRESERAGLIALLAVVVTFGAHSLIDWTWFIPGTAVPALACAGWLAGRGPISEPAGRLEEPRRVSRAPAAAIALISTIVVTIVAIWVVIQPLRASNADSAAETAALSGNASLALSDARNAAAENPVSVDPLYLLSVIYTDLGDKTSARRELVQATVRQPANPATWQELGCYEYAHNDPRSAQAFRRVLKLQPANTQLTSDPTAFCAGVPG